MRITDSQRWHDLATPVAIRVAATLRVADHIASEGTTAAELAGETNADADALERLLRHLVTAGLLRQESGRYALTARGALRSDHPSGARAVLDIESAIGRADLSFVHLSHVVRTGEAAFPLPRPLLLGRPRRGFGPHGIVRRADGLRRRGRRAGNRRGLRLGIARTRRRRGRRERCAHDRPLDRAPWAARDGFRPARDRRHRARKAGGGGLADRSDVVAGSFFDLLPTVQTATCSRRSSTTGTTMRLPRSSGAARTRQVRKAPFTS